MSAAERREVPCPNCDGRKRPRSTVPDPPPGLGIPEPRTPPLTAKSLLELKRYGSELYRPQRKHG